MARAERRHSQPVQEHGTAAPRQRAGRRSPQDEPSAPEGWRPQPVQKCGLQLLGFLSADRGRRSAGGATWHALDDRRGRKVARHAREI